MYKMSIITGDSGVCKNILEYRKRGEKYVFLTENGEIFEVAEADIHKINAVQRGEIREVFVKPDFDHFVTQTDSGIVRYWHNGVSDFRLQLNFDPEIVYAFFMYNGKKCAIKQTKDNIRETGNSLIFLDKIFSVPQ